jgi:hypothetical protein
MHLTPLGMLCRSRHRRAQPACCADKRFGKDYANAPSADMGPNIMNEPVVRTSASPELQQDPPGPHPPARPGGEGLHARRVEDMRPRIQQIVDETLDRHHSLGKDGPDRGFRVRPAVTIICDMLESRGTSRDCSIPGSRTAGRILEPVPLSPDEIKQGNATNAMASMYFPAAVRAAAARIRRRSDDATGAGRGRRQQADQ